MRQAKFRFFLLPLFFVLACAGLYAQANSEVTGIVTDQTGASVPGAKITLTDPATGSVHTSTSNDAGLYNIAGLNAANYNLKVTAKGFQTYVQTGVVVNISQTFRVDIKLTIGAATQTVIVEADALTVQADSNVVGTLINEQQITDLPTNGRNVISLAALGLGVSGNLPDMENPFSVNANYAISFNGLNQAHNIWIVDGGEDYDRGSGGKMSVMPSQDSLSEFQVLSSNYPPDYGIASGGTVTMSIKSGASTFHGEAWEFDRNDALDAHNYFDNNAGQHASKPELRYNVFGFNVGGPVYIPHVYNSGKKKTFFFFNEEWRRMINGQSTNPIKTLPAADEVTSAANFTYTIPTYDTTPSIFVPQVAVSSATGAQLLADFPTLATYTPAGSTVLTIAPGQTFAGNTIPGNLLDPNALRFNATKNLPAATNLTNDTYTPTGGHLPIHVREDLFRIDHTINDKWSIFGHYIHDANVTTQATPEWQGDNYPTIGSNFSNPSYSSVIKLTGQLKPNVLLEAAMNYDGNKIAIIPVSTVAAGFTKPSGWNTGTYFPAANDVGNRLPDINWTTVGEQWGPGNDPWTNGAEDYNTIEALSVTLGRHQLKFGGGYNRYTKNQVIGKDSEGDYTFNDGWAVATSTSPAHLTGTLTGDSYVDFLLGLAYDPGGKAFSQSNANPINHYVNNTISAYAQDNWHVNSRLSIQYGVRFDAMPLTWERRNQVSNFNPTLYQTGLTPAFNSDGTLTSTSPGLQTYSLSGVNTKFYLNGIALAGQEGTPRGIAKNDFKTVMPRVGFSYDLFGTGKTVLRGGFGTFYERVQGNDIYDAAGSAPFISTPQANSVGFTNINANWQSGTTASNPITIQSYNSLNTYYPHPGVAQYSLGVQHELAPALILTAQYVGNIEWHQNTWIPINNFPLSTPLSVRQMAGSGALGSLLTNQAVTYPGYGQIRQQSNVATGTYNSAQVGVRQQSKHGLSYEVDYTWSHQIDSTQTSVDVDNNNPTYNPWNLKYDKGSGSLDRRHVININYEYKLPFFNHATGVTKTALGGWEISGTVISESGLPWLGNNAPKNSFGDTVGLGGDYSIRPDQTSKVVYPKKKVAGAYQYVSNDRPNTTCNTTVPGTCNFVAPMAAWLGGPNLGFGNSGKDAVVGPRRTNFTTALTKSFAFGDRAHFEFHAESFNTFNHTQFNSLLDSNPAKPDFGFVNGTQDPREFELGGRFVF